MSSSSSSLALPAMMASVVVSAVANTIIRRIALVPMERYPYFLTQLQTFTYVILYSSILWLRYQRNDGTVTKEMLQIRKTPFLWIGFWDSVGDMLGNVGTSRLPGYQVPLLAKLNIVFTAVFSSILLGKRYSWKQVMAMTVVLCGSFVTLVPTIFGNNNRNDTASSFSDLFYAGIYVASVAPTALAFVLKEQVFRENQPLNLDIFVVNSYGSIVGLVFSILLLPLLATAVPGLGTIPLTDLPSYVRNGWFCFTGHDDDDDDSSCAGAPTAPLLYFGINVTYNICFLTLIKHGGALLTFITNTVTFPLSTILFAISWPLLGASTLNVFVVLGLCVELIGIVIYQRAATTVVAQQQQKTRTTTNDDDDDTETNPIISVNRIHPTEHYNYGSVVVDDKNYRAMSRGNNSNYLEQEPPLCISRAVRESINSSCCNCEELCKSLLSPKCCCG